MAGIAGIASPNKNKSVHSMLKKIAHRGSAWREILEDRGKTIGVIGLQFQLKARLDVKSKGIVRDGSGNGRFAQAQVTEKGFKLKRDPLGIAPLYFGWIQDDVLCFASEVKGLLEITRDIHELPPGHTFDGKRLEPYYQLTIQPPLEDPPEQIAQELRRRLEAYVEKSIGNNTVGAWLSGGLDSSTMAALACSRVERLPTFAVGLPNAPDLEFARVTAKFIQADHHEVIINPEEIYNVLPDVIYYLESFDALLVRSSVLNYLVAKRASDFVQVVFSGEGGDELFAGYKYLKSIDPVILPNELIDITNRLHNTALQRVDRCASAHGTVARVGFLDPDVVDYALRIPAELKLHQGVEKWILRRAMVDALPELILNRPKAKFWQGAGIEDLLARYAEEKVSTADFKSERNLPNGWRLNTKEELLYYRIFKEHFGVFNNLSWMGRTKGAPIN